MTSLLTQRAEELRILGWTDEGANRYAAISEDTNFQIDFSHSEILFSISIVIVIVVILLLITARNYVLKKRESSIFLMPESISAEMREETLSEKDLIQSKTIIIKSSKYSIDKSTIDQFISFLKTISVDTDKLIIFFLTIFTFVLDAWNLSLSLINNNSEETYNRKDKKILDLLSLKSDKELKEVLEGVGILENLERENLINLIKSNSKFLERLSFLERKRELEIMKNSDLKLLLVGVEKISRLNKSQLVERILLMEYGNKLEDNN